MIISLIPYVTESKLINNSEAQGPPEPPPRPKGSSSPVGGPITDGEMAKNLTDPGPPPPRPPPRFPNESLVEVSNANALIMQPPASGHNRGCFSMGFDWDGEGEVTNLGSYANVIKSQAQWVSVEPSDLPIIVEGIVVREPGLATNDLPMVHNSHDFIWYVAVDIPGYYQPPILYRSATSPVNEEFRGYRTIEMEWEVKDFNDPMHWPFVGDRAWALGKWIFDCGHAHLTSPGGLIPGSDATILTASNSEFRTEIHPPQAVAFSRNSPFIFPGNDGPSDAIKTFIYIHGKGGYYNTEVGGERGNYAFDIVLPPKPSSDAAVRTQIISATGGLMPVLTPFQDYCNFTTPCTKVHVFIPYSSVPSSENNKYKAIIVAGWDEGRLNSQPYRELQVTLDSMEILKCKGCYHEDPNGSNSKPAPDCFNPDRRIMFAAVNGKYKIISGYGAQSGLLSACDGEKIDLGITFPPTIVKENGLLQIRTTGYERDEIDDYFGCGKGYDHAGDFGCTGVEYIAATAQNDYLCSHKADLTASDNFGMTRSYYNTIKCDDSILKYHVDEIKKFPAHHIFQGTDVSTGEGGIAPPTAEESKPPYTFPGTDVSTGEGGIAPPTAKEPSKSPDSTFNKGVKAK